VTTVKHKQTEHHRIIWYAGRP